MSNVSLGYDEIKESLVTGISEVMDTTSVVEKEYRELIDAESPPNMVKAHNLLVGQTLGQSDILFKVLDILKEVFAVKGLTKEKT